MNSLDKQIFFRKLKKILVWKLGEAKGIEIWNDAAAENDRILHQNPALRKHKGAMAIPADTLYGWIKKWRDGYLDIGPEARSPENIQHLNEEIEQLRQRVKEQERTIRRLQEEREILADATAFFASSRRKLGSGKD